MLPRHLKQAAKFGGAAGMLDAGFKPRPQQAAQQQAPPPQWELRQGEGEEGGLLPQVYGPSWQRQYAFVAATMPSEGDTSVGAELTARFPGATWLAGRQLHQSKRSVEHTWRRVEDGQHRAQVLQEVVSADEELAAGSGRMLVFARDVASAQATAAALEGRYGSSSGSGGGSRGLPPVLQYHKGVPAEERAAALARMGAEQGLVMVCTDAAARGLDVPDITHVVQVGAA
jgi:superfamily II DNA/RNA helicase